MGMHVKLKCPYCERLNDPEKGKRCECGKPVSHGGIVFVSNESAAFWAGVRWMLKVVFGSALIAAAIIGFVMALQYG